MSVSYRNHRHIRIGRNRKKKYIETRSGISHYQMCRLANEKDITTDVTGKICAALHVLSNQIMEYVSDDNKGGVD